MSRRSGGTSDAVAVFGASDTKPGTRSGGPQSGAAGFSQLRGSPWSPAATAE